MNEAERKVFIGQILQEIVDVLDKCTYLESPAVSGFVGSTYVSPDPVAKIDLLAFKKGLKAKAKLLLGDK